jgi:homoserine kinase
MRCIIRVPASTSNMGPGFDAIGCAIQLWNLFDFTLLPPGEKDSVKLTGEFAAGVSSGDDNLALLTAKNFFRTHGKEPPSLALSCDIAVPHARGLGSSSTALLAGMIAANAFLGGVHSREEILDMAVAMEGHPDNVAPELLGGLVVSASRTKPLLWRRIDVHRDIDFVFVIPGYGVRTEDARRALPQNVPMEAAIHNASRTPLLVMGLERGDMTLLAEAISDQLHQPYRQKLFHGYEKFAAEVKALGSAGICVSGAGSAMLAICHQSLRSRLVERMEKVLEAIGVGGFVRVIPPESRGAQYQILPTGAAANSGN